MGYYTNFSGHMKLSKPLTKEQHEYINKFFATRRMARDASKASTLDDPYRIAVGLPIGEQGEYYVGSGEDWGQNRDASILNYNQPPSTQPSLWCSFSLSEYQPKKSASAHLTLCEGKNYGYPEWLEYIQSNFLTPWGVVLNGAIKWRGEDSEDRGVLLMQNGQLRMLEKEEYTKWKAEEKFKREAKKLKKELIDHLQPEIKHIKIEAPKKKM